MMASFSKAVASNRVSIKTPLPLLIIDSHPVQYKAPVYQALSAMTPRTSLVIYGTDASTGKGYHDAGFGRTVRWDEDLLTGYDFWVMQPDGGNLDRFLGISGSGMLSVFRALRPRRILLSQAHYLMDFKVVALARLFRSELWIRHETNDDAFSRPCWKSLLRRVYYRSLYSLLAGALEIGPANRRHLLAHGISEDRLIASPYCVKDRVQPLSTAQREVRRSTMRGRWDAAESDRILLFSGKLIEKKNPMLLISAMQQLSMEQRRRFMLVFLGSGERETVLRQACKDHSLRCSFPGFVNQSEIVDFYLGADIVVLPSRRRGETWGLVVNEALQAGCCVAISDAVGCHEAFGGWERVRVFPDGDAPLLADALIDLQKYPRDFDWCRPAIEAYSVERAASGIAQLTR